jgi:hypothetical protein
MYQRPQQLHPAEAFGLSWRNRWASSEVLVMPRRVSRWRAQLDVGLAAPAALAPQPLEGRPVGRVG